MNLEVSWSTASSWPLDWASHSSPELSLALLARSGEPGRFGPRLTWNGFPRRWCCTSSLVNRPFFFDLYLVNLDQPRVNDGDPESLQPCVMKKLVKSDLCFSHPGGSELHNVPFELRRLGQPGLQVFQSGFTILPKEFDVYP